MVVTLLPLPVPIRIEVITVINSIGFTKLIPDGEISTLYRLQVHCGRIHTYWQHRLVPSTCDFLLGARIATARINYNTLPSTKTTQRTSYD
jgi:hypothetical protein